MSNIIDLETERKNRELKESMVRTAENFNKESYSKQEVQDLINDIIHQDSFGDIFYIAGHIMRKHNMKMIDPRIQKEDPNLDDPDFD